MDALLHIIEHHGYLALAALVFTEAVGLPIPAALALVICGAASAWGVLNPFIAILIAVLGIFAGDILLFHLGSLSGWWLLGFLCRVAMNPETCILRSAESFYKRGRMTLLFAKFVPGINTMAPPLAGSMKMRFSQFLRFDICGASLYVIAYFVTGYVFSRVLKDVIRVFESFGRAMEVVIIVAVIAYIIYRVYLYWTHRYWTHRVYRVVPRAQVDELVKHLSDGDNVIIADVRSHGYYDPGAKRIQGSIRFEPNNLRENIKHLPKDKLIFLYCT